MSKKYELTSLNSGVYQIKALIDIPRHGVKAGDLGGLVGSDRNLSQEGDCWIEESSVASGHSYVDGNAIVRGQSGVLNQARVSGNSVVEKCKVWNNSIIRDNAVVVNSILYWNSIVRGNTHIQNVILEENCDLQGNTEIIIPGEKYGYIANVQGELIQKDFLIQGPALSSGRSSAACRDKDGNVTVTAGCFTGTLDEYLAAIEDTHKYNPEYLAQYRQFHANFVKHFSQ